MTHANAPLTVEGAAVWCQPAATDSDVVTTLEALRHTQKWSASRIAFELQAKGRQRGRVPAPGTSLVRRTRHHTH